MTSHKLNFGTSSYVKLTADSFKEIASISKLKLDYHGLSGLLFAYGMDINEIYFDEKNNVFIHDKRKPIIDLTRISDIKIQEFF